MIGQFNIDGIDAYERFGIFIADTGLVGLLQYPALKKVDSNDWPEEDGEEFDLSTPALETKTLQIKFASHKANRVGAFIEKISDKSYHDFEVPAIKQTFRLRLTDQQSLVFARENLHASICRRFSPPRIYLPRTSIDNESSVWLRD